MVNRYTGILITWLSLLFSINFSYATTINELAKTVVYLQGEKIAGTAFLTLYKKRIYVVTAAHVARGIFDNSRVFWNTPTSKLKSFSFKQLHEGVPNSKWFFHPKADIAVHTFGFPGQSAHLSVQEELYVPKDETIELLTQVVVVGFPFSLGTSDILSPIAKTTEIASWRTTILDPKVPPDVEFILLDDALAGGYSGAPVFVSPGFQMIGGEPYVVKVPRLIGIQSLVISDQTGGKISCVVPISYLAEIYDSNEFKEYESLLQRVE